MTLKYCCRECDKILNLNRCENICPSAVMIKDYGVFTVHYLFATRCKECDFNGCNDFRPIKEYR
jgi:hypothetical protein